MKTVKRFAFIGLAVALGLPGALVGCREASDAQEPSAVRNAPDPHEVAHELVSSPFTVDRIFRSMLGPVFARQEPLEPGSEPELLWITGYAMHVVGADGVEPRSIEYECHSNLGWPAETPEGFHRPVTRAFTLTQGQTDVRLPPGFGLPALSSEALGAFSQVLNLNQPTGSRTVRHRLDIRYVRDRDLARPMKPLVVTHAFVMTSLEGGPAVYNVAHPGPELEGASCDAGMLPPGVQGVYVDQQQRRFTGHWVVTPGRHEYRTLVTDQLQIPYDTTVHFIGVHVHPYSESVTLRDLTTGETVWHGDTRESRDRVGLDWIDYYSSEEGFPIYAGHQYELTSVYDKPPGPRSDGMASVFLYYLDRDFDGGTALREARRQEAAGTGRAG
jgi:hypothetical protein